MIVNKVTMFLGRTYRPELDAYTFKDGTGVITSEQRHLLLGTGEVIPVLDFLCWKERLGHDNKLPHL